MTTDPITADNIVAALRHGELKVMGNLEEFKAAVLSTEESERRREAARRAVAVHRASTGHD